MSDLNQIFSLHGRTVFITGAMGHLGKQMTVTLSSLGCNLILTDLPIYKDDQFINQIKSNGINCKFYACDIEIESQRIEILEKISNS